MYQIEMHDVSIDFIEAWKEAIKHLFLKGREAIKWLKCDLSPPILEHISFRIGNQIFFVRIIDLDCKLDTPSNTEGLKMISKKANGIACKMPIRRKGVGWEVVLPNWGLIDVFSEKEVRPFDLVTNEKIIMTDWEIQDFAVQYCKKHLENKLGYTINSYQGNPNVNPSIWFEDKNDIGAVVVLSNRYGENNSHNLCKLSKLKKEIINITDNIYSIKIELRNPNQKKNNKIMPLYRGHATEISSSDFEHIS